MFHGRHPTPVGIQVVNQVFEQVQSFGIRIVEGNGEVAATVRALIKKINIKKIEIQKKIIGNNTMINTFTKRSIQLFDLFDLFPLSPRKSEKNRQ